MDEVRVIEIKTSVFSDNDEDAAELGAAGEFIEEDEAKQDHQEHPPLGKRMLAIDLEEHKVRDFSVN